jgi:septum site-determining protein MinD
VAKIIVVTSGKGGVGKTTTSASFATGLALRGHKTVVIDFDVGLRNLDLILGCERRVVFDFVNVIHGEAKLQQALIKDKTVENLYILAASQTRDKDALTQEGVERVLNDLKQDFEYIICDSPAGIERGAHLAMYFADEALVVTNPEVSSVRDSDRVLGLLASKTQKVEQGRGRLKEHLVLTRYNPNRVVKNEMMSVTDIQDILAIPLLGVIPESPAVLLHPIAVYLLLVIKTVMQVSAYDDLVASVLGRRTSTSLFEPREKRIIRLVTWELNHDGLAQNFWW